jgi:uncharacterized membrane protein
LRRYVHGMLVVGAAGWCLAIVAAPILQLGSLYLFFSIICHQLPVRSWQIHGGQLGLCIRCTSISLGFLAGLVLLRTPSVRWLKLAIAITVGEWLLAVTFMDSEILRVLSGLLLGAMAAPIVRRGVEEMFVSRVRTAHEPM